MTAAYSHDPLLIADSARPLGPDSLLWRVGLERTAVLFAGRTLLMQVMHPVIGAGVRDFSNYREDPWGRLDRTLESLQTQLFGGEQAVVEAQRLRDMHKSIKGVGFDKRRYSALDPKAYAWVHLSTFDGFLTMYKLLGGPQSHASQQRLYLEWCQAGEVLGIRAKDMPADLDAFTEYIDQMTREVLSVNPTVLQLTEVLRLQHIPPPHNLLPAPIWEAIKPVGRTVLNDFGIGTMPKVLRDKLDPTWSEADSLRLHATATAIRTITPMVPERILQYPMAYEAQRAAKAHRDG